MNEAIQFLSQRGYPLIFCWVFAEQVGVPIPAAPVLLAAGVLIESGSLNLAWTILAAMLASVLADSCYYFAGRERSSPSVRRFATAADVGFAIELSLVLGKFFPWISLTAPAVSGASGMRVSRFLLFDMAGALLWIGVLVGAGYHFGRSFVESPLPSWAAMPVLLYSFATVMALVAARYTWVRLHRNSTVSTRLPMPCRRMLGLS